MNLADIPPIGVAGLSPVGLSQEEASAAAKETMKRALGEPSAEPIEPRCKYCAAGMRVKKVAYYPDIEAVLEVRGR